MTDLTTRLPVSRPEPLTSVDGAPARDEWTLDRSVRHLNHGSYGAVPRRTLEHQAELKALMERNPLRWFDGLPDLMAQARAALAPTVGVEASRIAAVPNASAGASVLFQAHRLQPGDEVVVSDHVYGAVRMGAQRWAERWGATVTTAEIPLAADEEQTLALLQEAITPRTRAIVVDHISSATARRFPVERLSDVAAGRGILLFVDGAHALGLEELPARVVSDSAGIFWFGNLHKFTCAPRGSAVLVAPADGGGGLHPLIDSWGAPLPYPERFDQQGTIDATGFLAAPHAIATIERLFGWGRVREYGTTLADYAVSIIAPALSEIQDDDAIAERGMPQPLQPLLRLPRGVASDPLAARDLKNRLSTDAGVECGITIWDGRGHVRISAHAYNVAEDYEQFVDRAIPVIAALR